MWEIILSTLVVSGIAALLAAMLVVAERFLRNYGECTIRINDDRELKVQGGNSLLESLSSNKIFIPSACGGRGTCAYCKVKVLEGGGQILPTETPYLTGEEQKDGIRLSCQVKVRNDLRIVIPRELLSIREYRARCAGIKNLTHDMREFRFELQEPAKIEFVSGQYIQLLCPSYAGNEEVYRAYSIASPSTDKKTIELVIRLVPNGICTTWCFNYLKEGDEVRFNGPYGDFRLSNTQAPIVFIAGGSGIAPIKSILHDMEESGNVRAAHFFFGANLVSELCYTDLMSHFKDTLKDFTFTPIVAEPEPDREWKGETGLVTEAIPRHYNDLSKHEGYLCGSPGMIDASVKVLTGLGMPEDKIYYDKFA